MSEDACRILNKKAVTYIMMVVSDEILVVDLKGLVSTSEIWAKLKATYENCLLIKSSYAKSCWHAAA